jgi:hypothetical protein
LPKPSCCAIPGAMATQTKRLGAVAVAFLFFLLLLCPASPARAQHIQLSNLILDNEAGAIAVRFSLALEEDEPLAAMLKEGAVVALRCQASLSRKREYWSDEQIAEAELISRVRNDALTREFVVEMPGAPQPARSVNLPALLGLTWNKIAMDLGPFSSLKRGEEYVLELKVTLSHDDVPAWMRWALFFWSWKVAPAATYQMEFLY